MRQLLILVLIACSASPGQARRGLEDQHQTVEHLLWIEDTLVSIQTIRPGMTRGDLEKLFVGGADSTLDQSHV